MLRAIFYTIMFILSSFCVWAQPNADFTSNITSDCMPQAVVKFKDISTGNPVSFSWDFGNGQTSTLQNPTVIYTNPGKYTVILTATNASGSSVKTKTNYITVFKNPTSAFSANLQMACIGQSIGFTDLSSAGDATITSWHWDFGDGSSSTAKNPTHAYSSPGKYNINLIVYDANTCHHDFTKSNYIEVRTVNAEFAASQTYFCKAPAAVTFTNLSSPSSSSFTYDWDFGDGGTSAQKSPLHTYSSTGTYSVKLKITDSYGCTDEIIKTNYIKIEPINAAFTYKMTDACSPATVDFTNSSTPSSGMTYNWNFGNGGSSTKLNPLYVYGSSGTFTILLTVSQGSCTDTVSRQIKILQTPYATISADTQLHCKIPFTVRLSAFGTANSSYLWDLGNGNTSTAQNPIVTYTQFGSYNLSLTITSADGCKKKYDFPAYIVSEPPSFKPSLNPNSGCAPLTSYYSINDTSLIPLTKWKVTSGHGETKTSPFGSFTYPDTGEYIVTFIGTNDRGCKLIQTASVKVGMPPVADFEWLTYTGCNDTLIQFKNLTNTHNPKADSFLWNFGDNKYSKAEHPSHKFQDTGYHSIYLQAFFHGCASDTTLDSIIYIYDPIARIDAKYYCANYLIKDINNSIGGHLWEWNFGDNSYSTLENPSHSYAAGKYMITLKLTDTITKCIDYDTAYVFILDIPKDDFTAFPLENCSSQEVSFTDTSTQDFKYVWEFGDGDRSYQKSPKHYYIYGGAYTVRLTITDSVGCVNTIVKTKYIKISDIKEEIQASPIAGCIPLDVHLSDKTRSAFKIIERKWDMGNGKIFYTQGKDTLYTYKSFKSNKAQKDGYDIILKLTDSLGCTKYPTKRVYPGKPVAVMYYNVSGQCKEAAVSLGVRVHDTLINEFTDAKWYFNGDYAGSSQKYDHYFYSDTTVIASVVLIDKYGCSDTAEQTITIVSRPPKAVFDFTLHSAANNCPPVIANFRDKSIPGSKPIISYYWDFGNGSYSTNKNPSNTYSKPGLFTVILIVEDSNGCKDTLIMPDIVKINGATGSFAIKPKSGCDSLSCIFTPQTTRVIEYTWSFGDGSISNDSVAVHTYNYPGKFIPVLIMEDSLGCKTSIVQADTIFVYKSPDADFDVKGKMTCAGHNTRFINLTQHEQKIVAWYWNLGNGQTATAFEPAYSYNDTGKYSVSLVVVDEKGCHDSIMKENIVVIYYDTINPENPFLFSVTHIADPGLDEVLFSANHDFDFRNFLLNRTDYWGVVNNGFEFMEPNDTLITDTLIAGLYPQCYVLETYDYCENISDPSKLHCLIYLNAKADSFGNHLTWSPYVGWDEVSKYEIFRKDFTASNSFRLIDQVNGKTIYYLDTHVNCADSYYYRVKAYEKDGYFQNSLSNTDGVQAAKYVIINAIELIRVSVENEKILIEWEKANLDFDHEYLVYKSADGKSFQLIKAIDQNTFSFIDENVNTAESYYYYRIYVMHKNCYFLGKKSNIGKSILLKINNSELSDEIELNWTAYEYWKEGVKSYEVNYQNKLSPVFVQVADVDPNRTNYNHLPDPMLITHSYKVTAIRSERPEIISNSNIVTEVIEPRVYMPNSFTPNGDGINDIFNAKCYGAEIIRLKIFNRWGEMIFETTEHDKGWDGIFKNEICQMGVYYYHLEVRMDDVEEVFYGTLNLLR